MGTSNSFSMVCSLEEMDKLAAKIAQKLLPGSIITLEGELGAGKTTFTAMLCKHLPLSSIASSPTFTYLNIYEDKVAHFDLYRLKNKEEFFALGFEEYLGAPFITIIEWPGILLKVLKNSIAIKITHHQGKREVTIGNLFL